MHLGDVAAVDGNRVRLDAEPSKSTTSIQCFGGRVAFRYGELDDLDARTRACERERGIDEPKTDALTPRARRDVHAEERGLVARLLSRLERQSGHAGKPRVVERTENHFRCLPARRD